MFQELIAGRAPIPFLAEALEKEVLRQLTYWVTISGEALLEEELEVRVLDRLQDLLVAIPAKRHLAREHYVYRYCGAPNVDLGVVLLVPEDLRRLVPPTADVAINFLELIKYFRQAEIRQLNIDCIRRKALDENVLQLDVPVHNALRVQVLECLQQLLGQRLDVVIR